MQVAIIPLSIERTLRQIEEAPWHAVYRVAIGFLVFPAFSQWRGAPRSNWQLPLFFVLVLAVLRVVPALLRFVIPFSRELQNHWFECRRLAKLYDSYQWRKLLWFGVGMTLYVVVFRTALEPALATLIAGCLLAGALGEWAWRGARRRALPNRQP